MIQKLKIQFFQSHSKTNLEFDSGINLIVGQSDSGKTAVFRALKWLATNRPSGDAFQSTFTDDPTCVELETDEGTVVHTKGKYSFNKTDFSAIGTSVPEQIQRMLNLDEINWQSQMDAPYLLSESSGEVSRRLNEVADLSSIDKALSNLNSTMRENNQSIRTLKTQKEELLERLEQYEGLDELAHQLKELKQQEHKAEKLNETIEEGLKKLNRLERAEEGLSALPNVTELTEMVEQCKVILSEVNEQEEKIEQATDLRDSLVELLKKAEDLPNIKPIEKEYSALEEILTRVEELKNEIEEWSELLDRFIARSENFERTSGILKELEQEFVKKFPDTCPLCGKGK